MIRTFATAGSKHIASVSSYNDSFVILNNPDIEALQIFAYDSNYDNFYEYQNVFFGSRVTSLGVFYDGGKINYASVKKDCKQLFAFLFQDFGESEAFVATTTRDGWFYIYEYMFYGVRILLFNKEISSLEMAVKSLT